MRRFSDFPRLQLARRTMLARGLAVLAAPLVVPLGARANEASDFDALVNAEMLRAGIPGLALGYAREGRVQLTRGYGVADLVSRRPVTVNTVFPLASVTKPVTATVVMQLVEQGRLGLDDAVGPHLGFPLANPHHPDAPITVRQLLTHTSSLSDAKYYEIDFRTPGKDASLSLDALLEGYLAPGGAYYDAEKCFSTASPGAQWDYCNIGIALLGHLVERISGQDLRVLARATLFAPLGMSSAAWTIADTPQAVAVTNYDIVDGRPSKVEPMGFPDYPVGTLRASAADLIRFVAASANGGEAAGVRILGEDAMAQMLTAVRPQGLARWLSGQGLGWQRSLVDGVQLFNHAGGDPGVFTFAFVDPATRSGLVVLTNVTTTSESMKAVKAIAGRVFAGS
ncbi:D-alanyl-D-alanine carboxypeptidase precursor [Brevundimonas diminuta]|nr:D-alanyl-D-alanine carboxypeptidase precursor [Brevundimonas diminuta]